MTQYTPINRRSVLETIAGGSLAAIAGCIGENGDPDESPDDGNAAPDGQDTLDRVAVDGTELVIELTADTEVDQINLIQPNGELFGEREVAAGVERVSFEIGTSYEPGEYRVLALQDGETAVKTALNIRPELHIREMGIGRNQPEKMWDDSDEDITDEAFVTVENDGTGPDAITKLLFLGDVPYPSDEDGTNYADAEGVSGIYDPDADEEVDRIIIGPDEQLTIYSSRSPFAFVPGSGTSCKGEKQTGQFDLVLDTQVGANQISKTYNIEYSASGESDECDITIGES